MRRQYDELALPPRLLLGAGPSNPDPRVLRALALPPLGPLDPIFTPVLDEVQALARHAFRTRNLRTFPVLGTARAGLDALLAGLIEDGDRVVVVVHGPYGVRLAETARRYGAVVDSVEAPWGSVVEPDALTASLRRAPTRLVAAVQADPATGAVQPLAPLAAVARAHDALFLADATLSLGGCELDIDAWEIDACAGGLGACLAGPVGLAPLTYSEAVEAALLGRTTPPRAGVLDLVALQDYWSPDRRPSHAPPSGLIYALREALRLVHAEGLERRWKRHRRVGDALVAGLQAMGLRPFGEARHRAPMLAVVHAPEGIVEARVRQQLLLDYGTEISGGLGALYGRVWRIGALGYNARIENVLTLLAALEQILGAHGHPVAPRAGPDAAQAHYGGAGLEGV
ncbi:MAG TPA: alanine--glyoxylate aminotransferase family protein [Chloroflexota bacterium]|jgi:aspartate aminotransferase-like enzyme